MFDDFLKLTKDKYGYDKKGTAQSRSLISAKKAKNPKIVARLVKNF